jgi:hypothetical protein
MRTCHIVENGIPCDKPAQARGWCHKHYKRWQKSGDPLTANTTHGMSTSAAYKTWRGMRDRCEKPNDPRYGAYGERGIRTSEEWQRDFVTWFADIRGMPNCPYDERGNRVLAGYSIDRVDNDGDYTKANLRWATPTEQANNRTRRYAVEGDGQTTLVMAA